MLSVPVNFDRLWSERDPTYVLAVRALLNEAEEARATIHAEQALQASLQART